ncbi:hypothetical protein JB92DRAFT_1113946 [Gautieria morchelliformis]|nr:hypothetical protein JB92DRAFT_1113946 [Gautieria morchelliformis]
MPSSRTEEDLSHVDPDDLFTRYTITEIRSIQSKLRADADVKQEELRLMVGERYRDLLQASTSIISIAESSRHVMEALADMRETVAPGDPQRKPRSSSIRGKDDAHLKVLQSLSAHLKLLLDAPEHLWRLLEKKQYLQAAWLFLLARIVHRTMVTEDPEEATWRNEGINVLAQFPLVQRQWDTIAQLRPQIGHRATQFLREAHISSESACSTILTLHLLDSLPLSETLVILLSQRSRTLNALLSHNLPFRTHSRPESPILKSRRKTPEGGGISVTPPSPGPRRIRNRKDVVREVRDAVTELLDVILGTMRVARDIFRASEEEGRRNSLVEQSLEDIQRDSSPESVLTTSTLLSTLPSSTHLLTLPPAILSYKPYIDLSSPTAHVDPSVFDAQLSTWFHKAMEGFKGRLRVWFAGLESMQEVWGLRRKVLERLQTVHGLDMTEKMKVQSVLDSSVRERMGEVASAALDRLERSLEDTLRKAVQDIREGVENTHLDITPSAFLFSPPPTPSLSQMSNNSNPTASPLKQFQDALRQRVEGRSPLLDRVLGEVESKAQEIEANLNVMKEDGPDSRELQDKVMTMYHQAAHASSTQMCQILELVMTEEVLDTERDPDQVVKIVTFVGRLCYYMSWSSCTRGLCHQAETARGLLETLNALHKRSIDCWRDHAVSGALKECDPIFGPFAPASGPEFLWPNQPSPQLIKAFLSLMSSLDRLGLSRSALVTKGVTKQVMQDFQTAVAQKVTATTSDWRRDEVQLLWDLTFLRQLSDVPPKGITEAEDAISRKLTHSHERSVVSKDIVLKLQGHIDHSINEYLPRAQILLAPLLNFSTLRKSTANGNAEVPTTAVKPASLLPLGVPKTDQDFRPAVETVKPSPRFGLLLVGSTSVG